MGMQRAYLLRQFLGFGTDVCTLCSEMAVYHVFGQAECGAGRELNQGMSLLIASAHTSTHSAPLPRGTCESEEYHSRS